MIYLIYLIVVFLNNEERNYYMYENNIKDCREELEMNQQEFGFIFNVSRKTVSGWENAYNSIPLKKLVKLCNLYNYSMDFVVGFLRRNKKYNRKIKTNRKFIGTRLKEIRTNLNLSQIQFTKKCGISQTTYCHYGTGLNLINTMNAYAICKTYNISMDYLIGRTNKKYIK